MGSWLPNKHRKRHKSILMLGHQILTHVNAEKCKIMFSGRDCLPLFYPLMYSKNILKRKAVKLNDNLLHLYKNKVLRNRMEESPRRCYDTNSK